MPDRQRLGLPPKPFLYTLDQVATLLALSAGDLKRYVYYHGVTVGTPRRHEVIARNIAPDDETPEWRVHEDDLIAWMRRQGFYCYTRTPT